MANERKFLFLPMVIVVMLLLTALAFWYVKAGPSSLSSYSKSYLNEIRQQGELIILTRNAPTTYYEGRNGPEGIEYDLVTKFSKRLGVKPRFVVKDSINEILEALANGEGHIAAAGLTNTEVRDKQFLFGPSYQQVSQQVVCRRGDKLPKGVEDLKNLDLWVAAGTSYVENLRKLHQQHPTLIWKESGVKDTEQLLELVWKKDIDCTVADSNIVAINRRYFPELKIAFELSDADSLVWLLPMDAKDIQSEVIGWFRSQTTQSYIDDLLERYYGHVEIFDYVDISRFNRRVKTRLPHYKEHFLEAASQTGLSWTLLAAQSYQESHWRPKAKSPTGVRGIMMLTLPTAREMGVKSRLNAKQSIFGGAKYLARLRDRIPESVQEPDRTWYALAAYNVGLGHIHDARRLVKRNGKNPDKWSDLSEALPLLAQKRYYKTLKHGYARGGEPVEYVNRIRDFQDLLENVVVSMK